MLLGSVAFVGTALNVASLLGRPDSSLYDPAAPALLWVQGSLAVFIACWLVMLRFSRGSSLRRLRRLELLGFGSGVAFFVGYDNFAYIAYAPFVSNTGAMLARASLLHWFFVLIAYGLIIPNTARRAAIVTGMIMVVAITSMLCLWLRLELKPGQLASCVTPMVIYMSGAAVFTVYASNRFEAGRRAIAEVRKLGQYQLGRRLGGGGMGEVFLAEHRLLKRSCAIKLIRPEKSTDATFVRRFEREVQAVTRLTHPSTVQVYDYGRAEDGALFYVMEYLPGLTLDQLVQQAGPLPPGRVVHILRQICGALAEAHASGLVHRDVKPGNVMVCQLGGRADVAKLFDFGLVAEPESQDTRITQAGAGLLGTPAYMSPEQARGESVGLASDLYSLGAVGYFLLTGRSPFSGSNALELLHAHQSSPVIPPGSINQTVPADLEAVILQLLSKDPQGRFESATALDNTLAACEPGEWTIADAAAWWDGPR
jgi:serine/threonine-protein kinase